jgi:hypothetical protein
VGVYAIAWLRTKLRSGNMLQAICTRVTGLVQRVKGCIRKSSEEAPLGREMKTGRRTDADDLKRSLIA